MATTFDIPLLNNSEEHVSLPLGKDILEDVDPIIQLLTKERVSLPLWVALGAEYYLAGLKNQAEQIFVAADKARQMIEEMQEGVGEEALAIALGTFYSIEAQLAADKDDEAESLRLRTLSTKYLDMENRDQETELPWLGSGVDLLRKNKIRDAKSRFTAALDLTENKSMYAMLGMAACSFIEGNYELSRNNYANCITLHKNCPPAVRVGLGHCFYMLNNHEYARKAFERARVLDPNNAQAAVGLAILKMNESTDAADLENVKLSMKLLREAYMDDQANPMALNHLANHFFWRGEMDRVKGFCRRSFETTTHNGMRAEALLLLARAHHKSGDVSKAKQFYKESETKYKEHAKVVSNIYKIVQSCHANFYILVILLFVLYIYIFQNAYCFCFLFFLSLKKINKRNNSLVVTNRVKKSQFFYLWDLHKWI
jgi:RNA polymerase-associated protein CTR9